MNVFNNRKQIINSTCYFFVCLSKVIKSSRKGYLIIIKDLIRKKQQDNESVWYFRIGIHWGGGTHKPG